MLRSHVGLFTSNDDHIWYDESTCSRQAKGRPSVTANSTIYYQGTKRRCAVPQIHRACSTIATSDAAWGRDGVGIETREVSRIDRDPATATATLTIVGDP